MNDILSLEEIWSQFPEEWILIDEPVSDDRLAVKAGKVLFHSKDREAMYRKAVELKPKRFATLFTGTIPEGTELVL
jgi:hypothetical protein